MVHVSNHNCSKHGNVNIFNKLEHMMAHVSNVCQIGKVKKRRFTPLFAKNFSKQTACLDFESLLASAKQKIAEKQTDLAEVERVFGYV